MSTEWMRGTGADAVQGAETNGASKIDNNVTDYIQNPLSRLLYNFRNGLYLYPNTVDSFYVSPGEIVCRNAAGTALRFRSNSSPVSVSFSDLDTGSRTKNVVYYVYAVADVDAGSTWTVKLSASATSPTGATYFRKLDSVFNDGNGASGQLVVGSIIEMFSGWSTSIPAGYLLCDGTNSTPDLRERFILGAGPNANPGSSGGDAISWSGGPKMTTSTMPPYEAHASGANTSTGAHSHTYFPIYYALAFIMRRGPQ